jgi:peptidyl-prolyl cis-trans isomerase A (cyclophilin A)
MTVHQEGVIPMRGMTFPLLLASVAMAAAAGCNDKKKQEAPPEGEQVELFGEEETLEEKQGPRLRPTERDFEKLLEPPACPEPETPDPLGGTFTMEQAMEGIEKPPDAGNPKAVIKTNRGKMTCELYADKAPKTVANFIGLARGKRDWWNPRTCQWVKKPFYDGLIFHRVIPNFMIQGGCPLKNGIGNPGYTFDNEIDPSLKHDKEGIMSMANAGPGTNGSQFFILDKWDEKKGPPTRLDGKHTVFGLCTPASVPFQIARVPTTGCVVDKASGKCGPGSNRPLEDVVIEGISVTY